MRELVFTPRFDRLFRRVPARIRAETYEKLTLFVNDPAHPSLRVKRIKGTEAFWDMSITILPRKDRLTFELNEDRVMLRRIGTHDILRNP